MFTLDQARQIATTKNVIFYKPGCPYCQATEQLFQNLISKGILPNYEVYYLGQDFDNETLTELVSEFDWKPKYPGAVPTKPQVFLNLRGQTEHFAGNDFFYASEWNMGQGNHGRITINGEIFETPGLANPMA
jgi:glutaredoxin